MLFIFLLLLIILFLFPLFFILQAVVCAWKRSDHVVDPSYDDIKLFKSSEDGQLSGGGGGAEGSQGKQKQMDDGSSKSIKLLQVSPFISLSFRFCWMRGGKIEWAKCTILFLSHPFLHSFFPSYSLSYSFLSLFFAFSFSFSFSFSFFLLLLFLLLFLLPPLSPVPSLTLY